MLETYSDGKKDGKTTYYYSNGQVQSQYIFSKGIKDGLQQSWDSLGNKTFEETFKQGARDFNESYFYFEDTVRVDYWDKTEKDA